MGDRSVLGLGFTILLAMQNRGMNYDITSALPKDVPSIEAMQILTDQMQVGESITIYWKDGSLKDVAAAVEKIKEIPKVINVSWLGTAVDPATPQNFIRRKLAIG